MARHVLVLVLVLFLDLVVRSADVAADTPGTPAATRPHEARASVGTSAAAGTQPAGMPDISFHDGGHYIGNLTSPTWSVDITGPDQKRWRYQLSNDDSGTRVPPARYEIAGTYEIEGDLVVFTGKVVTPLAPGAGDGEVRFGVNFGLRPKGPSGQRVAFNALFPSADGKLNYHRKWFRKVGGQWQPSQEIVLGVADKEPSDGQWSIHWVGKRRLWDEHGALVEKEFDGTFVYAQLSIDGRPPRPDTSWNTSDKVPRWLPTDLVREMGDGRLVMVSFGSHGITGDFPYAGSEPGE